MKFLLVSTNQFGYLVDYYKYYKYYKSQGHEVKYICWDSTKYKKIEEGNSDIIYVSKRGNMVTRFFRFINTVKKAEKQHNFDKIFIHYFPGVTTLLLSIKNRKMNLDIRTVSVHRKKYKRRFFDALMKNATNLFKNVSVIADAAAGHIGVNDYKLLPLGGAIFHVDPSQEPNGHLYGEVPMDDDFIFLYVGTLFKRRVIDCVKGFHLHLQQGGASNFKFLIIGQSHGNELEEMREYIQTHNLGRNIYTLGYIPQERLAVFFKYADCGVSYVPIKTYYVQPSTKTYEYLINGIPVLATAIADNIRLLEQSKTPCGLLIEDNAEDFARAATAMLNARNEYDRKAIAEEFREYEWDNLFRRYLDPIMLN
jgi:glycosyltransferase involved in cell wall biosynthesis